MKIIFLIAGISAGLILSRIFFVPFRISDNSMQPNYTINQFVLISKLSASVKGDAVLIKSPIEPGRVLFKRILAAEDDTVEIKNKVFYVNGEKYGFSEKRNIDRRIFPMTFSFRDNMPALKLKRNEFFVTGDNIDSSFDSREFGVITKNEIIGKAVYKR